MLIRFVVRNLFSFYDETEFNVLPNKTKSLSHHKIRKNGIDLLRLSAIYGANGSGKSNLVKSILLLQEMIEEGKVSKDFKKLKFRLNEKAQKEPISLGIEFLKDSKIYYYTLSFDVGVVLNEALYESNVDTDKIVFERTIENNIQRITFHDEYAKNEKNKLFTEVLAEKLLPKEDLLISFLNSNYASEFADVNSVFEWFSEDLIVVETSFKPNAIAHFLDKIKNFKRFSNDLIKTLNTGIYKLEITKRKFKDFAEGADTETINEIMDDVKNNPGKVSLLRKNKTGEELSLVYEKQEVFVKELTASHLNETGKEVYFPLSMESDGTKRLIDYLPAIYGVVSQQKVFIIDEIERSIHPIAIKEVISKISLDEFVAGQLIFTTHESYLLDQSIIRPDEIWFTQKDVDGASRLYSLSDYSIHNTANIENGYLNGRYGGIPFLSNLKDLNWHQYELSE